MSLAKRTPGFSAERADFSSFRAYIFQKSSVYYLLRYWKFHALFSPTGRAERNGTQRRERNMYQKGELVVGTSADYPPYEFHAEVPTTSSPFCLI